MKLLELYDLHQTFNKHEFKDNLICPCGLIKKQIKYLDKKELIPKMQELIKQIFGSDDIGIMKEISEVNYKFIINNYYYFGFDGYLNYVGTLLAYYGVHNYKVEISDFILQVADIALTCEKADLSFLIKANIHSGYFPRHKEEYKMYIEKELIKRGKEEELLQYIKKYKINNLKFLFAIPIKYLEKVNLFNDKKRYSIITIDENYNIDDLIKRIEIIKAKKPDLLSKINLAPKILYKLSEKI